MCIYVCICVYVCVRIHTFLDCSLSIVVSTQTVIHDSAEVQVHCSGSLQSCSCFGSAYLWFSASEPCLTIMEVQFLAFFIFLGIITMRFILIHEVLWSFYIFICGRRVRFWINFIVILYCLVLWFLRDVHLCRMYLGYYRVPFSVRYQCCVYYHFSRISDFPLITQYRSWMIVSPIRRLGTLI